MKLTILKSFRYRKKDRFIVSILDHKNRPHELVECDNYREAKNIRKRLEASLRSLGVQRVTPGSVNRLITYYNVQQALKEHQSQVRVLKHRLKRLRDRK